MTDLEKRAAKTKWQPPPPGSDKRKEMPSHAFISPSTRTFPYKVEIDGQWVISEPGLRSVISVANFRGNSIISAKASELLEELLSDKTASHFQQNDQVLQHYGVIGMKWGVRKEQKRSARAERKDIKWVSKKGAKIQSKVRKSVQPEIETYRRKEMGGMTVRTKSGQLSKEYINAYNQKLASLMNEKVGDVQAPSGKVVRFVAKRGEVGVYTALADQGYNMDQIKRGVHASGRVAYKKEVLSKAGG